MITWIEPLYMDGITKHVADFVMKKAKLEKVQYPVFLVTFPTNENNLLDIIDVNELLFPYYKKRNTHVLGMASSRQQAKIMAAAILSKVYDETGDFDLKSYFRVST